MNIFLSYFGMAIKITGSAQNYRDGRVSGNTPIIFLGITCMNEEDQSKVKVLESRVLTSVYIYFSDATGQRTPMSVVEFRRNSNSSKLLWLSLLPARMKKIQSKIRC